MKKIMPYYSVRYFESINTSLDRIIKVKVWLFEAFIVQKYVTFFVVIGVDHTELKAYLDRHGAIEK